MKIKVLFVCLGNICRSPMAEAIFAHKVRSAGLSNYIEADSCGTASYHVGHNPDHRTIAVAKQYQVPVAHKGRQLSAADLMAFDYIMAMDKHNLDNIMALGQLGEGRLYKMRYFDEVGRNMDVPDPYYGEMRDFEEVYDILDKCCQNLLDYIIKEKNLDAGA